MAMVGANGRRALAEPGLELVGEEDRVLEEIICHGLLGANANAQQTVRVSPITRDYAPKR